MSYQLYLSDLTGREWGHINRLIPAKKHDGRKRQADMRLTINANFYIDHTGCQWRYLPREYPPGRPLMAISNLAYHWCLGADS